MKSILVFSHSLETGGAERALIGLLEALDRTKYEVDLFLMHHSGEFMKFIPDNVRLLPEIKEYTCMAVPISEAIRKGCWGIVYGRWKGKRKARKRIKELHLSEDNDVSLEYSHKYTLHYVPRISAKQYDLGISFLTPHYYLTEKVNANKKIAWIHTDYSAIDVDKDSEAIMWSQYDRIAAISQDVQKSFVEEFPELKDKVFSTANILPVDNILEQSNMFDTDSEMPDDGSIKLLSVGRFCYAKNFESVPVICRKLLEMGCNVKWYLIGYGTGEQLIKERIAELRVEQNVIILGKKGNPYPYMTACDWYIQPSRYEGKCISVIEAQMLHKPVIITRYNTSSCQLKDGIDGIIVPQDIEGCATAIRDAVNNDILRRNLIEGTFMSDYSNRREVDKIYRLIGD